MQLKERSAPAPAPAAARGAGVLSRSFQMAGELLMTAGVIVLLFVAWQLWWTNVESDARQRGVVKNFAHDLKQDLKQDLTGAGPLESAPPSAAADDSSDGSSAGSSSGYGPAIVSPEPADGVTMGIMYVPRFGADFTRPLVQGTTPAVLDTLGIGHYPGTAMPGAVGNFAVAGHRQTHGAVLDSIDSLVPGDRIYVQIRAGYYVYVFRNSQIVFPSRTDVLLPVPAQPAATPKEGYLTMTSCNPRFGSQERFIAYSLLEWWQPASAGPPAEIASQVARVLGEG
ncbi:class E sortase [Pseudarthrobacter sp. S9]|uniref:class E sortase n=1 Tax=Pseudarthrobacter sp. S9 TaxID=3418421 RepID=UPI003D07B183